MIGPSFLNPAVIADDIRLLSQTYRVAPISGVSIYRPTSVFVSTGRFGNLLVVSWMIVFGFSGYLLMRFRSGSKKRFFVFLALALIAAGCVMASSRGVFMWTMGSSIVGAAAFIWGAPWRQGEARRILKTLQRASLGIAFGMAVLFWIFPEQFANRLKVYSETLDPRSPTNELAHAHARLSAGKISWALSAAIAGLTVSASALLLSADNMSPASFRLPLPRKPSRAVSARSSWRWAIVGLALWFVMAAAVLISAWKVVRKLRGSPWFPLGFMIFWYAFLLLLPFTFQGMQAYQDFVLNAYLWLTLGILFRLPKLAALRASGAQNRRSPRRSRPLRPLSPIRFREHLTCV